MLRKLQKNFLFIFNMGFLILAFLGQTFWNSNFKWSNLLNTDGLTLLGIVVTFIVNLAPKVKSIRKLFYFIFLKLNILNIDYEIRCQIKTDTSVDLKTIIRNFHECIKTSNLYLDTKYDLNWDNKASYKIYHRAMASNITIKNVTEAFQGFSNDEREIWEIQIDSVNKFGNLEKNIKFLINTFIEKLQEYKNSSIDKIQLVLNSNSSEFDISNKFELVDNKKYEKVSATATIRISDKSNIQITNLRGLTLSSASKGDFVNGFDVIKSILIG